MEDIRGRINVKNEIVTKENAFEIIYSLGGKSLMADTLISKDPGITVNLLNLSGFLKSDSNFIISSSVILLGS